MEPNNNDDFTYDMYLANLQDRCDDSSSSSSLQCCILQYMIFEKEELLIRFVNEFTHFWKKNNVIVKKTKHTDECKTLQKKKLWGDYDDDDIDEC